MSMYTKHNLDAIEVFIVIHSVFLLKLIAIRANELHTSEQIHSINSLHKGFIRGFKFRRTQSSHQFFRIRTNVYDLCSLYENIPNLYIIYIYIYIYTVYMPVFVAM